MINEMDVYQQALEKWGWDLQAKKAIQELAEAIVEISKRLEGRENHSEYVEELVDAEIMINQMKVYSDGWSQGTLWDATKTRKLQRVQFLINEPDDQDDPQ
jgi:hypothetical protein